jgi:hypothetical protein
VGPGEMPAFQALSYGEKWRVTRFVARGEAPPNPQMAAAAVELGESYQRRGRTGAILARWLPIAVVVFGGSATILSAANGNGSAAIFMALVVLVNIGALIFNPMARPENVARSLTASRQVIARKGSLTL